jgi:1-acyl-sn-glycerol-3-phosphate acyltransferase
MSLRRSVIGVVKVASAAAMFAYFGAGGAALSWAVLPWLTRGMSPPRARRRARAVVARGFVQFHAMMRALRLMSLDPRAVTVPAVHGPCVIVANHPTLVDTPAAGAVFPDACFLVRQDFYRSALFGPLLRACGHIDAGERGTMAGAAVVQSALDRLAEGASVLVFPEGTRSPPGGVRRFRRGAFEIACRADVPVVAMRFACDPPMLTNALPWHALPDRMARYTLEPLAVLHPRDFGGDAQTLARHVQELYRSSFAATAAE